MSLFPATTLRCRLEPGLLSFPRLPGPLLVIGITTFSCVVSNICSGGGGDKSGGCGGLRATTTGAASRPNTPLWYFCKHKIRFDYSHVSESYSKRHGSIFILSFDFKSFVKKIVQKATKVSLQRQNCRIRDIYTNKIKILPELRSCVFHNPRTCENENPPATKTCPGQLRN